LAAKYNATSLPEGPDRSGQLMGAGLSKSLTLRGFIQREFLPTLFEVFLRDMSGWVASGQVQHTEDSTEGLERAPEAFVAMLRGANFGKAFVRVSSPGPTACRGVPLTRARELGAPGRAC